MTAAPNEPVTLTAVTSKMEGNGSVITIPAGAVEVPWLVTIRVNVTTSPTLAEVGLTDLAMAGSSI